MENNFIFIGGGVIDFHINKEKYEKLKSEKSRKHFIYSTMENCFADIKSKNNVPNLDIREVSITSNNFWGEDTIFVNDIGYSSSNPLPKNEKYLTCRISMVDVFGLCDNNSLSIDDFHEISSDNYLLKISNRRKV